MDAKAKAKSSDDNKAAVKKIGEMDAKNKARSNDNTKAKATSNDKIKADDKNLNLVIIKLDRLMNRPKLKLK